MVRVLIVLVILAVLVWGIARVARSTPLFRIRVRNDGVEVAGRVPGHSAPEVRDFIATLALPEGAEVRAYPAEDRVRFEFSSDIPPGDQQRIRNFLYLHV